MLTLLLAHLAFAGTTVTATTASGFSWTTLKSADDPIKVASFTHQKVDFDIKCSQTQCTVYKGSTKVAAKVVVGDGNKKAGPSGKTISFVVGESPENQWADGFTVIWGAPAPTAGITTKLGGLAIGG